MGKIFGNSYKIYEDFMKAEKHFILITKYAIICMNNKLVLWRIEMKRYKKLFGFIIPTFFIILCVIYFYPRELNGEYSGIMYRLGDSNYSESLKVSFNGYLSRRLINGDKFQGTINIGGNQLSRLDIRFDNDGKGDLFYYDKNIGEYRTYGFIISNNIKSGFVICVLEDDTQERKSSTWSSKHGLVIAAPADNRNAAVDMSNKLMKSILKN